MKDVRRPTYSGYSINAQYVCSNVVYGAKYKHYLYLILLFCKYPILFQGLKLIIMYRFIFLLIV